MAKDDFKITEHRETLHLHFGPVILRENLRKLVKQTKEAGEKAASEDDKKSLLSLQYFYEDVLEVVCWAFTKLEKAPKPGLENGKKKGQNS